MKVEKLVSGPQGSPLDVVILIGLCAVIAYLTGCGYAIVPIPGPGQRVSISSEQRIESAFSTAVESAEEVIDPVSLIRRRRR